MSNNHTLDKYRKSNIKLVGSLVLKLDYIGVQDNLEHIELYGDKEIDLYDKTTWKYYINLTGEYHTRNERIQIKILETNEYVTLTKGVLDKYPETRKELHKQGSYYKELLDKYPREISLINSILYPTTYTIAELIELEDGYIIAYNKDLLEDNEYTVLEELNKYSLGFFTRWYNKDYTITDNLYLSSVLGTLYSKLLLKLFNVRYSNVNTYQVHSFYLDLFFKSNLNLNKEVHVLNRDSKIWLYRNLRYLRNNIGKDVTLQRVIDNLCTPNGVGVGEIQHVVKQSTPTIIPNRDFSTLPNIPNSYVFQYKARNSEFTLLKDKTITYRTLLGKEFSNNHADSYIDEFTEKLNSKNIINKDRTKDLVIDEVHKVNLSTLPKINTMLDVWFSGAINNTYSKTYNYTDSNTGFSYILSPKTGMLFFIKILYVMYGHTDNKVFKYVTNNIPYYGYTTDTINKDIYQKDKLARFSNHLLSKLPSLPTPFLNSGTVKGYVDKLDKHMFNTQLLISNMNEGNSIGYSHKMVKRLFKPHGLYISTVPKTIDELLVDNNLNLFIGNNYNYVNTLLDLLSLFTGYSIEDIRNIDTSKQYFKSILTKLTSYTVQVLGNDDNIPIVKLGIPSTTIDLMKMDSNLIAIKAGGINCLDVLPATFTLLYDKIHYDMEATVTRTKVDIIESEQTLQAYGLHSLDRMSSVVVRPTISIHRVTHTVSLATNVPTDKYELNNGGNIDGTQSFIEEFNG